jgi:hypothetical protein
MGLGLLIGCAALGALAAVGLAAARVLIDGDPAAEPGVQPEEPGARARLFTVPVARRKPAPAVRPVPAPLPGPAPGPAPAPTPYPQPTPIGPVPNNHVLPPPGPIPAPPEDEG